MENAGVSDIKSALERGLDRIGPVRECDVYGYPYFFNVGDHLIWLGLMWWLVRNRKARIRSISSFHPHASASVDDGGDAPVIFTGGGNLGDLWPVHQKWRETVVLRHCKRPVILMPQSVYFKDPEELKFTARIFNAHPDLTIFVRDRMSYAISREHFTGCRVFLVPDLAFALAGFVPTAEPGDDAPFLLHSRNDQEKLGDPVMPQEGFIQSDWCTMTPVSRLQQKLLLRFPFLWHGLSRSRVLSGLAPEWRPRLDELVSALLEAPNPSAQLRSLEIALRGVSQFSRCAGVVTNRLHGHILASLMGLPSVLLANNYHKNRSFYDSWMSALPTAGFAEDPAAAADMIRSIHRRVISKGRVAV